MALEIIAKPGPRAEAERRQTLSAAHQPVLLATFLEAVQPQEREVWLDATFGAGGYSRALLQRGCRVIALDWDEAVVPWASLCKEEYPGQFHFFRANFLELGEACRRAGVSSLDGAVFDLGVSSLQLDDPLRGFSFRFGGPLDMRMDRRLPLTAADLLNQASLEDLVLIFQQVMDRWESRRLARAVLSARLRGKIDQTTEFADLVERTLGRRRGSKIHPATRPFLALRIAVNRELDHLEPALEEATRHLAPGGRLAVVAFHSLEDRVVKRFLKGDSGVRPAFGPHPSQPLPVFERVRRYLPEPEEVSANPRARSARLRIGWKRC
jgi:16S rRNA (cytosine1402-N4)-methyltransferase